MLKCNECKFKRNISGDNHISCSRKMTKVNGINQTGVSKGWFMFPLNFDPIWADKCDAFIHKDTDLEKVSDKQLYAIFLFEKERGSVMNTNMAAFRENKSIDELIPKDDEIILKEDDRLSLINVINETWKF